MDPSNFKYLWRPSNYVLFLGVLKHLIKIKNVVNRYPLAGALEQIAQQPGLTADTQRLEEIVTFTDFIVHRLLKISNPCLLRCLFLYQYLQAFPLGLKIAFGIRHDSQGLAGHAWLVRDGDYYLEAKNPLQQYRLMYLYPAGEKGAKATTITGGP